VRIGTRGQYLRYLRVIARHWRNKQREWAEGGYYLQLPG
jgi:hypothetical protein